MREHENHEKLRIPLENNEIMKIIEFRMRIMKIMKIIEFHLRIKRVIKILKLHSIISKNNKIMTQLNQIFFP